MSERAPWGSIGPSRRSLRRLASRLARAGGARDPAADREQNQPRPAPEKIWPIVALLGTLTTWLGLGAALSPRAPQPVARRSTVAEESPLPSPDQRESTDSLALVTSLPSTAPTAHRSERCLPVTEERAARCYVSAAVGAPRDERVLRNLIIAHRLLDDWTTTSRLAAQYWRRYPRSPFLSGIRPLVYGPDSRLHPLTPPGLTPASWTERLSDAVDEGVGASATFRVTGRAR